MSTQTRTWQRKILEAAKHDAYADLYWYIEISWQAGQRHAPAAYPGAWIPVIPVAPNPEASRRIAGMLAHLFALSNTDAVATYEPALTEIIALEQTGCRWYLWDMDVEQDAICVQCGAIERIGHTKVEGMTWLCAVCGDHEENTMGMTPREYQWLAARTLIDAPGFEIPDEQIMVLWNAIGLAGESGEVCEIVKKGIFHQHGLDREKLHKELGDVMWYVAALCTKLGFDLGDVMAANIEKLKQRYPNGYNSEDSKRRADV